MEKQSDIIVVFDKSGSMAGEKMNQAVLGAKEFVRSMDNEDWVMWMPFDDNVYQLTEGQVSKVGEELLREISGTSANGGTALYDAVGEAYTILDERRQKQGDSRRYGIVVLSDGQNTGTARFSLSKLLYLMKDTETDPTGIQMHTIGIGGDADKDVLTNIASATQGKYWEPNLELLTVVYKNIAKYF